MTKGVFDIVSNGINKMEKSGIDFSTSVPQFFTARYLMWAVSNMLTNGLSLEEFTAPGRLQQRDIVKDNTYTKTMWVEDADGNKISTDFVIKISTEEVS